ncbi:PD-(D/E)XK nuclease family protein [Fastidiosibacter lacustris]|uniref:PD-(D/E)XK nuclease family protein n=1 Tax=Fastidiosibacter lacustris TaxID=2056695 RepID=UPI000E3423F6|nr:PD-(D/E)XK nuclease family protein [Fastidiosibacter lacustris]
MSNTLLYTPYVELFKLLDESTIVITVNNRLAKYLNQLYLQYCVQNSRCVLFNEYFYNLDLFIKKSYTFAQMLNTDLAYVISDDEAQFLFFSILQQDERVFMPSIKQAKELFAAWQLLQNWQIDIKTLETHKANVNVEHFLDWGLSYQALLHDKGYIDKSQCIGQLLQAQLLQELSYRQRLKQIILIGFDSKPPLIEAWLTAYRNINVKVSSWSVAQKEGRLKIRQYVDHKTEINAVAQEVFRIHQLKPNAKIGVIVPDLQSRFYDLRETFDAVLLDPAIYHLPLLDNAYRPYSISGGEPLLNLPIIQQLFLWLKFDKVNCFSDIALMLGSSYVKGYKAYAISRQKLILKLKTDLPRFVSLRILTQYAFFYEQFDPLLQDCLKAVTTLIPTTQKVSVDMFVHWIKQMIEALNYLDECTLSSLEYQALSKFYLLLNKLLQFERLGIKLMISQWLVELSHLAAMTVFQTQTIHEKNIQILGVLEATEIAFDYLFIVRMSDNNWPSLRGMNPYLPFLLQKEYAMPHSSVEREFIYAKTITKRLIRQADEVCISYAEFEGENQQSISALISQLGSVEIHNEPRVEVLKPKVDFISFMDDSLPVVDKNALQSITGGTQIFKNLAECPYRAALVHRLKLTADKPHKPILSALRKGIVIHHVLEHIWRELKGSQSLQKLTDDELKILISRYIDAALQVNILLLAQLPDVIKKAEESRLVDLITKWLKYERMRQEPFHVIGLEKSLMLEIGGVNLQLRVDRIDQLSNGYTVVIDYKISKNYSISGLLSSPIMEPQLPLYAVYEDSDAVAVATVNGANISLQSISSIENWIKEGEPEIFGAKKSASVDAPQNFNALKRYWRKQLELQIQQFLQGKSIITPSVKSCQYCEFSAVCRVSIL